mmetsp:Transcript_10457/g.29063  ORF Transcript_10457/g.29063 Transcript_10457/m.29063 type:complete len:210 (-) Transcript_10457:428-1057(-)
MRTLTIFGAHHKVVGHLSALLGCAHLHETRWRRVLAGRQWLQEVQARGTHIPRLTLFRRVFGHHRGSSGPDFKASTIRVSIPGFGLISRCKAPELIRRYSGRFKTEITTTRRTSRPGRCVLARHCEARSEAPAVILPHATVGRGHLIVWGMFHHTVESVVVWSISHHTLERTRTQFQNLLFKREAFDQGGPQSSLKTHDDGLHGGKRSV